MRAVTLLLCICREISPWLPSKRAKRLGNKVHGNQSGLKLSRQSRGQLIAEGMNDRTSDTVLKRIATAGREEQQARAMSLQKAMRVTLAKVADALLDLPMAVIGAVVQSCAGDQLGDILSDDQLLILMDGPGGTRGAVMLEQTIVGGLIQQQTLGTVRPNTSDPRPMTRTDAAICAPLIDLLLANAAPILDAPSDAALIADFRFGAKAEDARTLSMALDLAEYAVVRLTVDMALGARQGEMVLILPKPEARLGFDDAVPSDEGEVAHKPDFTNTVMELKTDINMVLCDVPITLRALENLSVGDVLPIPPGRFPNVQMVTITGRIVGKGAVGHVDGVRAVKPTRKPSHATQPLRRESDARDVEMPRVEELDNKGRRKADKGGGSSAVDLPTGSLDLPDFPDLPDMSGAEEPEMGLPGLDDLPSLDDMPEIAALEEDMPSPSAGDADLPDLDDLPDLADLPDLSDLPDLADLDPMKEAG